MVRGAGTQVYVGSLVGDRDERQKTDTQVRAGIVSRWESMEEHISSLEDVLAGFDGGS